MPYYAICSSCRKKFELLEGSMQYKQYKERKTKYFTCEKCNEQIRFAAIKQVFGDNNTSVIDDQ
ncbi:DUF2197 domain-containing protein [Rummeliibacillus suwonensis]|nr:DUF2197 domain-containing protein [Rummeliibacillus suwonensis]MBO2535754.1 DUF2197 domain-containing protein [Rummeliibacillus suwonensis]